MSSPDHENPPPPVFAAGSSPHNPPGARVGSKKMAPVETQGEAGVGG